MKKRILIRAFAGAACLICFVSCFTGLYEVFRRSMVSNYILPSELLLRGVSEDNAAIRLIMARDVTGIGEYVYDLWCEKHGDMSYNRYDTIRRSTRTRPHEFIAADYVSVEVTSSADWDGDHPAGASLGDIAMFYSASPIKYIQSGYTTTYSWDEASMPYYFKEYMVNDSYAYKGTVAEGRTPFHAVNKEVSALTPEDLVLLGSGDFMQTFAIIKFTTLPTAEKSHTITVTMTTDEEQVFSAEITKEF